jgi:hypothetical protein
VPQLGRNYTDEDDRKNALQACDGTDTGRFEISPLTPLPDAEARPRALKRRRECVN